jgi:RimJ/RimL family protein N-acetyltransferase
VMKLRDLEDADFPVVAGWLSDPQNARWLRFGPGVRALSPTALKLMARRDLHKIRVFSPDDGGPPVGVVALADIDREFRTATLWYVLGDAAQRGRGLTSAAVSRLLTEGFASGLRAVGAWVVDGNVPSLRVLQRNRFRLIGRQRMCHDIDGCPRGRLLFDLLASEHREGS